MSPSWVTHTWQCGQLRPARLSWEVQSDLRGFGLGASHCLSLANASDLRLSYLIFDPYCCSCVAILCFLCSRTWALAQIGGCKQNQKYQKYFPCFVSHSLNFHHVVRSLPQSGARKGSCRSCLNFGTGLQTAGYLFVLSVFPNQPQVPGVIWQAEATSQGNQANSGMFGADMTRSPLDLHMSIACTRVASDLDTEMITDADFFPKRRICDIKLREPFISW